MHIKFTRMEYEGNDVYKELKESVWIPVEVLKQAVIRQEETRYRIFLQKDKDKPKTKFEDNWWDIEVVKENPIELLKKYEEEKEEERKKIIKELGRGSQ